MRLQRVLCAFFLLFLSQSIAEAQIAADIRGRVLDSSSAIIPNATVELTQSGTKARLITTSSGSGDYFFTSLTPGAYQLDVTASGFEHLSRAGITAIVGQTVSVDLVLSVGRSQQTIKVTADAPLLQSETSNVETNIPGSIVIAMPLNTRNFVQLATLAPGVELPPARCCPASTEAVREQMSTYLTESLHCSQNPARSPTSRSSTTSRSSP